jgi:hypothetical protein
VIGFDAWQVRSDRQFIPAPLDVDRRHPSSILAVQPPRVGAIEAVPQIVEFGKRCPLNELACHGLPPWVGIAQTMRLAADLVSRHHAIHVIGAGDS